MIECYVSHSPHVSWRRVLDYVLIIDHKNRQLLTLDDVAGTIWEQAESWRHTSCIIQRIRDLYDVDRKIAEQDVTTIIQEFAEQGLLVSDDNSMIASSELNNCALRCFGEGIPLGLRSLCVRGSIPLVGCVEITEQCNLRCQHCYNALQRMPELSLSETMSVLDDLAGLGCLDLLITGGEPTLHPGFLDIIWYARQKRFSVTIKTNATRIDSGVAQALKNAFVNEVHVSVYSVVSEEHDTVTGVRGSLNKTMAGISNLIDSGIRVQIACPLTTINYGSVKQLKEWASDAGINCAFDPMIIGRVGGDRSPTSLRLGQAELKELYDSGIYSSGVFPYMINTSDASPTALAAFSSEDENLPLCGAGSSMVCVTAYGDVIPCVTLPINAGNVRDKSLEEIWRESAVLKEVRGLTSDRFSECVTCDKLQYCMRCPGVFYSDTGSILRPSPAICLLAGYAERILKGGEING